MKKITLVVCFMLALSAKAQLLQNGDIAPNFTVTDMNGNSHTLYDYLNAGKRVVIDMGGPGCGPSWKYHESGELQDFYLAYGPKGSDEVVVFWMENGIYYDYDDLADVTDPQSFGDWTAGVDYPIVLNAAVHNTYSQNVVPRMYRIRPDKTLWVEYVREAKGLRTEFAFYSSALTGVQNHAKIDAPKTVNGFCSSTVAQFQAELKNYGSNAITHAVLQLKKNGVVIGTKTFTGNISQFDAATISFDPVPVVSTAVYTAEIVTVNNVANRDESLSSVVLPFTMAVTSSPNITVKVHTFTEAYRMKWKITNDEGVVVYQGGPYSGAPNTIITHNVTLPNVLDCYTLTLTSTNGMGWKNYAGDGLPAITPGIQVFRNGNQMIFNKLNVRNFGDELVFQNFLRVNSVLGAEDFETEEFRLYPNPTTGLVHIDTDTVFKVNAFDMAGKLVMSADGIGKNSPLNISGLSNGIYIAKMTGEDGSEQIRKIVLSQ